MSRLIQPLRTILAFSAFFAMVYLNDVWTYLAPTHRLRRWGATIFRILHPAWPGEPGGGHQE